MNKRLCSCVALFFAGPSLACAQAEVSHAPIDFQIPFGSSVDVERDRAEGLIKLDVVVTDGGGNPVAGLGRDEFKLLEEGQPQKILSLSAISWARSGPRTRR